MKKILFFALALVCILQSCKEDIDTSSRYVFKEETITGYLEKHEMYSEYVKLLNVVPVSPVTETTVFQLLSARGHYTVFAPTNAAIQSYLDMLCENGMISAPNWDSFTDPVKLDSIRQVIVYNSIIDSGDDYDFYETANFPINQNAEFPMPNMNDRKLPVRFGDDGDSIFINDCPIDIINRDIHAINGVIHAMGAVINPSNNSLGHLLKDMVDTQREGYLVMATLIKECGLIDTLDRIRDEVYENLYQTGQITDHFKVHADGYSPQHRYYGYTLFAETDSVWSSWLGKPATEITVDDVRNYLVANNVYPDAVNDDNYEKENNLLNRFVTYHLLPERLSTDHLVYHYNERAYSLTAKKPTVAMAEWYTTMGKRRLMKIFESAESNGVYLNRFPELDNRRNGNYHEVSCDPENEGIHVGVPNMEGENNVRNGIIYPIEKLLVYDDHTRDEMQKGRIRWDMPAMWPEMMNNDIRISEITDDRHKNVYIPHDNMYRYLNDVWMTEETEFVYWTGRGNGWQNYLGDELNVQGLQDITMRLPPVPKQGTYELRFAIQCGGNMRGMVQVYWGSDRDKLAAMDIPMDLRQGAHQIQGKVNIPSDIGYEADTDDDDFNAEVDKKMRNKGFMKGCKQICAGGPGTSTTMRESEICLRRLLVRQPMDPDKTYYIRFKTVMDDPTRYLYTDYLEYVPKEVYDNPNKPEDIW